MAEGLKEGAPIRHPRHWLSRKASAAEVKGGLEVVKEMASNRAALPKPPPYAGVNPHNWEPCPDV